MTHMTPKFRAALTAIVLGLTLVLPQLGQAAINPRITVATTATAGAAPLAITLGDTGGAGDAFAKAVVYVPAAFSFVAPPTTVGTAAVTTVWTDRDPQSLVLLSGGISAVSPSDPRIAASSNCDPGTHTATWLVSVTSVGGDSFAFPIYVDATTGTETQFGATKLVFCFLPPTQGLPNRASDGNKFVSAQLKLNGFSHIGASGTTTWRSLWTPYTTGTATLNAAGAMEAQSTLTVLTPSDLVLTGKIVTSRINGNTRKQATVVASLSGEGTPIAGVIVLIKHGITPAKLVSLGKGSTSGKGTVTKTSLLAGGTYFQAGATLTGIAGACNPSFSVPCSNASGGAVTYASNTLHLRG